MLSLSLCLGRVAEEPVTLCLSSFVELNLEPVTQFEGRNDEPVTMSIEFVEGGDDEPVTLFGCMDRLSVGLADDERVSG
jgi:hypothetical protein